MPRFLRPCFAVGYWFYHLSKTDQVFTCFVAFYQGKFPNLLNFGNRYFFHQSFITDDLKQTRYFARNGFISSSSINLLVKTSDQQQRAVNYRMRSAWYEHGAPTVVARNTRQLCRGPVSHPTGAREVPQGVYGAQVPLHADIHALKSQQTHNASERICLLSYIPGACRGLV